eukprot:Gregarina_sp_Poly_1__2812@NODE_1782_length_3337_cov_32_956575_g1160_i0_p6_GENE_NODE_1782_length_3337_cov_32_956575_g1160_i0NODE_1782_length_3337_cov_32_956575_g1160_i0_p6_ORF_typecomplete_len100_score6_19_NODE_1782_length_3337_cov_32_956575_g1160_i08611160
MNLSASPSRAHPPQQCQPLDDALRLPSRCPWPKILGVKRAGCQHQVSQWPDLTQPQDFFQLSFHASIQVGCIPPQNHFWPTAFDASFQRIVLSQNALHF